MKDIIIETCNTCKGTGVVKLNKHSDRDCPVCNGLKKVCVIPYRVVLNNS